MHPVATLRVPSVTGRHIRIQRTPASYVSPDPVARDPPPALCLAEVQVFEEVSEFSVQGLLFICGTSHQ